MLLGATLALAGCGAVRMKHAVEVDNLVVDRRHVSFTVSRVDSRVIEGPDMHFEKPMAARGEYYAIPIDSGQGSSGMAPLISFDTLAWIPDDTYYAAPAALVVNPVKAWLMPYMDRRRVTNKAVFPSNSKEVFWHGSGAQGYAYADSASLLLTHIKYEGESCTIALPSDVSFETLANNVIAAVLSNDGQDVAITRKQGDVSEIRIYRGCKETARRTLRFAGRLIGFGSVNGDYLFSFQSRNDDVSVLDKNSEVQYFLPREVHWKKGREVPHWPSIFDYETKRFFWLGVPEQTGEYVAVSLYQYDPLSKQDRTIELKLGSPLDAK